MAGDPLISAQLRLRAFCAEDADNLVELDADPAVMRYLTGGVPTERSIIEQEILPRFVTSEAGHPLFGFWAAEVDGRFSGWFAFRPFDAERRNVSLGYRLARRVWGSGYATTGAKLLVDAGFRYHGVQRVIATTYEENTASIRVLEKLGMRLSRRFRYTPEDLALSETSRAPTDAIWPGDDLEFTLERRDWLVADEQIRTDGECR